MQKENPAVLNVATEIGTDTAVSTTDGDKLFAKIDQAFEGGNKVQLDFSGVKHLISAFLNAAIGQLYSKYNSDFLNSNLFLVGLSGDDFRLLKNVIERAKEYFKDRDVFENNVNDVLGDE